MTLAAWLETRQPLAPPLLRDSLRAAADSVDGQEADPAIGLRQAAETELRSLIASGETGRDAALSLLTVDALVTYAYEAAAEHDDAGFAAAIDGMTRLSRAMGART